MPIRFTFVYYMLCHMWYKLRLISVRGGWGCWKVAFSSQERERTMQKKKEKEGHLFIQPLFLLLLCVEYCSSASFLFLILSGNVESTAQHSRKC